MDDPIFKEKYQKCKLRVKVWEKDFKKKFRRIPSKYDIHEAPRDIRDSYKMYYKLKTSFLEETLNEVFNEDGFDIMETSQGECNSSMEENFNQSINGGPQLPLDISSISFGPEVSKTDNSFSNINELPTKAIPNATNFKNHIIREFEPVQVLKQNEEAWGINVSKTAVQPKTPSNPVKEPFKMSFNPQLFKPSTFSKRNPRKSLSRSTSDSSSASSSNLTNIFNKSEILPDLETILIQKAKEQQNAAAASKAFRANPLLVPKSKESITTHVNEGWLNRCTAQNALESHKKTETLNTSTTSTPGRKQTFGLSNLDVSKIIPNRMSAIAADESNAESTCVAASIPNDVVGNNDSDSVVSNSEDEQEVQEYRHIVKRRRIIPTIDRNQEPKSNAVVLENKLQSPKPTIVVNDPPEEINESNRMEIETKKLPSESDNSEDDNDSTNGKKPRKAKSTATRKKAVPKRAVNKNGTKENKKAKKPLEGSAKKLEKTKKSQRTTNAMSVDVDEDDQKPLNPEDLKYSLALESVDITSVPRENIDDLALADLLAQRYIDEIPQMALAGPTTSSCGGPVNEKREAARRKLAEKIVAGKLNENFVQINIQKKVFARGKKSVNYSKYKKKLWKDKKKVAALIGPDMNMGGCDGGVLTCFTCGQPGHFADRCKVKGDSLLPLSAQIEEDPSPFPTLEEAEKMASQSAVAVHSRNIEKLPQASNPALYRCDEEKERDNLELESEENDKHMTDSNQVKYSDGGRVTEETDDEDEDFEFDVDQAIAEAEALPKKQYIGHKIPKDFLERAGLMETNSSTFSGIGPLYDLNPDGTVKEVTPEVLDVLHMFGHSDFRKGQDRAVMRILSGLSTLVTLSTGSGKSLCYQLPAYIYSRQKKSITLVISPLVSLMEDQVTGVPHFLRAHCLHTNQTPQQRAKILQLISDGEIDILLVSPEAVVSGERSTGFGSILRQLPPIAFACIDEAHCVSQWSHNFRPSYLMICKVLKNNLGVKTVLGLTATATLPTRISIIRHLGITDGERGIISDIPLPDNLILSISKDENRDAALIQLLNSSRFELCQSIIVYCTRRDECERIAGFIRTCMQDRKIEEPEFKKKRKRINWHAEPYHAGMPSSRRRTIQNAFMKNELRIVVATIAFGMGINKPDIRSVIHYNMPRNFESYVQEIGRAGRDGKIAHCHLFLDARGADQYELRRHIYANSIDRHVIRKLLQQTFVPCSCNKNLQRSDIAVNNPFSIPGETLNGEIVPVVGKRVCPGHEVGFSVENTVQALDIPQENISTLLCYMELDSRWNINVLSSAYIMAKVISYGGPKFLKHAAKDCPPLAMAIALQIKKKSFKEDSNIIEFSVIDISAAIGWSSGVVKYQLKNLEWIQVNGFPKRSPITVSFYDLGFRLKAPGDFTSEEIDDALDTLYCRSVKQEHTQLIQLQYVFQGLSSVAYGNYVPCTSENFPTDKSEKLKNIIREYFQNDYPKDLILEVDKTVPDDFITNDVYAMLNLYPDNNFTGRNIARIFNGISSPNYPAVMWSRCKYWRAHSKTDFNRIVQLANEIILKMRT